MPARALGSSCAATFLFRVQLERDLRWAALRLFRGSVRAALDALVDGDQPVSRLD